MKKKLIGMFLLVVLALVFNAKNVSAEECSHIDNGDEYNNLCDNCYVYLGEMDLVLGENTVNVDSSQYIRFIPLETAIYDIYSTSDSDPHCNLYEHASYGIQYQGSFDDSNGTNFSFSYEFVEGNIYYLVFGDYGDALSYTVTIAKHEHSSEVETCKGYLCSCGIYYGEKGEHRLSTNQTCKGYQCLDCYLYFGEALEHELSGEQTCGGYKCTSCHGYFGEEAEIPHTDEDRNKNLCDVCKKFLGEELELGENNIIMESRSDNYYFSFTPQESGNYFIYSKEDIDFYVNIKSSLNYFPQCVVRYEDEYGLYIQVELNAQETYYIVAYTYNDYLEGTFNIELHEHFGLNQYCGGYKCDSCLEFYGEKNDLNHYDGSDNYHNRCDHCDTYIGSDLMIGENNIKTSKEDNYYLRFIPEESGNYYFYSKDDIGAWFYIVDSSFNRLEYKDEWIDNYLFSINIELVAGEVYYLEAFIHYEGDNEFTVNISKHTHSGSTQNCLGYQCETCFHYFGEGNEEHDLDTEETCIGTLCLICYEYVGEGNSYKHNFYDGECDYCGMNEEDYECIHETDSMQSCKGYLCKHCHNYYGEGNGEHDLDGEPTCKGRLCWVCFEYFGEVDENNHRWSSGVCYICDEECEHYGEKQTCQGYLCEECYSYYGEVDEDKHVWYYGSCEYHYDITYPLDLECEHNLDSYGRCEKCGIRCEHVEVNTFGECENCEYQFPYSVTTNNITTFHNSLSEALDASSSGSYVKMLRDDAETTTTFDKDIIFDINGCEMYRASLERLDINANVRFIDSVGGGFVGFPIIVNESCIIESGSFSSVIIFKENTYLVDIIHPCTITYFNGDVFEIPENETEMDCPQFVIEHSERETCIGTICTLCNEKINDDISNSHYFEVYEKLSDAKCEINAKEISTCIYCKTYEDIREISNSKLEHEDLNFDHICDNDCGKNDMGIHEDKDLNHICDYGCKDLIGECIDSNLDHACDYGCEKEIHQYSEWKVEKEATETVKGLKSKTCSCGHKIEEEIQMLSVTSEPDVNNGLSVGAILGIIFGSISTVGGLFSLYWFVLRKKFR